MAVNEGGTAMISAVGTTPSAVNVSGWRQDDRLRPGKQVFAIGDVHGRPMELDTLLQGMASQSRGGHLVLLGDIIDRGPDSAGAIAVVNQWFNPAGIQPFAETTLLIGNHDLFYLTATAHADEIETNAGLEAMFVWDQNGGGWLLDGIGPDDLACIRSKLIKSIGLQAVKTYEAAHTHIELGNLLLVHAGLRPDCSVDEMFSSEKLDIFWNKGGENWHWAWIRWPFLQHEGPFEGEHFVIHGHTPEAAVMRWKGRDPNPLHCIDGWRLGLDGSGGTHPTITGAEIVDGRYRIFTVPILTPGHENE